MRTSARWHGPRAENLGRLLGKAGNNSLIWVVLCGALALADAGNREAWLVAAALGPVVIVFNFAIKVWVRRPRPVIEGYPSLGGAPSSLSFPSAHASSSFAVGVMALRIEPAVGIPMLVLAVAISLSRPYLGMHYPSDVAAGAILGSVIGALIELEL